MKNLLLNVVVASTLTIGAFATISTSASAQSAGGRGAGADSGGGHAFVIVRPRRGKYRGSPPNRCECTIRKASKNGSAATYKVCKKSVQLLDGSRVNRICEPTG